jgi:hypothetical protein
MLNKSVAIVGGGPTRVLAAAHFAKSEYVPGGGFPSPKCCLARSRPTQLSHVVKLVQMFLHRTNTVAAHSQSEQRTSSAFLSNLLTLSFECHGI